MPTSPGKFDCDELKRLLDTYNVASHRYEHCINELQVRIGIVDRDAYDALLRAAEEAKAEVKGVLRLIDTHRRDHKC